MSVRLGSEDRRAIDLILDQGQSGVGFTEATVDQSRVSSAHDVLKMLDLFAADEPAPDLLTRTMHRVGAEPATAAAISAFGQTITAGQQAHA